MRTFFKSGRMMAIVERDLRKFFRSPALMVAPQRELYVPMHSRNYGH